MSASTTAAEQPVAKGSAGGDVNVLFCANPDYFQHAAVAAVSLAAASGRRPVRLHLVTCDEAPQAEAMLRESLRSFPNVTSEIYHVSPEPIAQAFVDRHLSKEAYLRFLAPEILPAEIHRVVYLDCDLVVLDDISSLHDADLGNRPVGAVRDFNWEIAHPDGRLAGLGLDGDYPYVNSGVLVMDLDLWRRADLSNRVLGAAVRLGARSTYHDQDALNVALSDQIQLLDRRWNLQAMIYSRSIRRILPRDLEATEEARANPGIIHFTTAEKPWKFRSWVRKKNLYYRFLDRTCWRHAIPVNLTPTQQFEYRVTRELLKLGLDPYFVLPAFRRLRGTHSAATMVNRA
jgi:lipopolysaccharide biosynthesis glycosyltransferase